jgi:hypothetical protein
MALSTPVKAGKPGKPPKMRKRHPFRGLLSGLALGIGLVILCVSFSLLVTTSYYVYAGIFGASVILGIVIGLFGPTRTRRSVRRAANTSAAGPIAAGTAPPAAPAAAPMPGVATGLPEAVPFLPEPPDTAAGEPPAGESPSAP